MLAVDLFCGLGGWAEGFLAEGYAVVGFDIEWKPYPGRLVIQDVRTLDGRRFKDATVIVASPPCQEYSYRAMPWKRAKALPPPSNELFETCFRIQREACEAAGRHVPLIVENVCGAQRWVGRAKWHYGSYYLWGDVPALMPPIRRLRKSQHIPLVDTPKGTGKTSWFFGNSKHEGRHYGVIHQEGVKAGDRNKSRSDGGNKWDTSFADTLANNGTKALDANYGTRGWFGPHGGTNVTRDEAGNYGLKFGGGWWHDSTNNLIRKASSRSAARRQASALIAKIPFPLARHIARVFRRAADAEACA